MEGLPRAAIIYGASGEGTYYNHNDRIITIDSNELARPLLIVRSMAHEQGHKNAPSIDWTSLDSCLDNEGAAQLNTIIAREEILSKGGPDIGIAGGSPYEEDYLRIYEDNAVWLSCQG